LYFADLYRGQCYAHRGERGDVWVRDCLAPEHCSATVDSDDRATYLDQLRHLSPLLFNFGAIFLLHHAQARYRQLELYLELVLPRISCWSRSQRPGWSCNVRLTRPRAPSCLVVDELGICGGCVKGVIDCRIGREGGERVGISWWGSAWVVAVHGANDIRAQEETVCYFCPTHHSLMRTIAYALQQSFVPNRDVLSHCWCLEPIW
jgi:hypothetical protein